MNRTSAISAGARRRRRRRRSGLRCCLAVAAAALAARTPSKLMTHALLSNAPLPVTGTRTPASAYRSGMGSSAAAPKMQASSAFGADGTRGRRCDRGRRGGGDVQRFGLGVRTPAARSWTALAASRENEGARGGGDGGGGGDVEESSVAGVWAVQDEEDWEFEEEVQRLEERLERAVKNEDYKGAAKCRDELYRIHMDETSAVLSTNSAFYAAFTAKDADRMVSLWMPSNDVMCVHPGDEPVLGQQAVARSWRSLFRSGDGRFSSSVIKPTDVRIRVRGTTAIVQCNEKVTTRLPSAADAFTRSSASSPSSSASDGDGDGGFSKDPEHSDAAAWLAHVIADSPYEPGSEQSIVSNPTTAEDRAKIKKAVGEHGVASIKKAVDKAFSQTDDSVRGGGRKKGAAAVAAAAAAAGRRKKVKPRFLNATNIYRKAGGRWLMVHHHASLPPPPKTSNDRRAAMGMDGMKDGMEGMTRIVNLSDLGAGGFGGSIGGGKENKLEEMLEALRNRLPGALGGSIGGGGAERLASGMIIIGGDDDDNDDEEEEEEEEEEDNDEDGDDDDDEDEDEGEDEDEDGHDARSSIGNSEGKEERRDSRWSKEELPLTEDLTKKTIQTLRTLVEIKVLEKDEQRRLMTDVIQHATAEEASPVEVAYELLLAHTNEDLEDTDSLAEFVDQCKILAASLFKEDEKKTKRRRWRR